MAGSSISDIMREAAAHLKHWSKTSLAGLEKRISKLKKEAETCRRQAITQEEVNMEHVVGKRISESTSIYF
jgi:hypothetical protein